jgi:hypothetical protein
MADANDDWRPCHNPNCLEWLHKDQYMCNRCTITNPRRKVFLVFDLPEDEDADGDLPTR